MLLPEEPAGRISTSSAGAALLEATLLYPPGDTRPCPVPGEPPSGARFGSLALDEDPAGPALRLSREVRALCPGALSEALDGLLRAVTVHAALADAVLEARAVRLAEPEVHPAAFVEALARDLWAAGIPVSFGPSWTPAPGVGVAVGTQGLEEELDGFLRDHPAWRAWP